MFDIADVGVWLQPAGENHYTEAEGVTVAKTADQPFDTVSVTFPAPVPASTKFVIQAARVQERSVASTQAGIVAAMELERELSKQSTVLSEVRRDIDRSMRFAPGVAGNGQLPTLGDGET
ncbi:hypothetical protein AB4144_27980, partial [Rhizobiaceae sp. 2RAB30]